MGSPKLSRPSTTTGTATVKTKGTKKDGDYKEDESAPVSPRKSYVSNKSSSNGTASASSGSTTTTPKRSSQLKNGITPKASRIRLVGDDAADILDLAEKSDDPLLAPSSPQIVATTVTTTTAAVDNNVPMLLTTKVSSRESEVVTARRPSFKVPLTPMTSAMIAKTLSGTLDEEEDGKIPMALAPNKRPVLGSYI
jgi:hypothetical protein